MVEESGALRRQPSRARIVKAVLHPLAETAFGYVSAPRTRETSFPPHPVAELERVAPPRVAPSAAAAPLPDVLIKPVRAVPPKLAAMQESTLSAQPKCEAALFEVVAGLPRECLHLAREVAQCRGADDPLARAR